MEAPTTAGRLRRGSEIRRVLRTGRRYAGARMVVYVRPGEEGARAAFVCGRRVGRAVARNRARRLLREAWRVIAGPATEGCDVVFVARSGIHGATMAEVAADMVVLLSEAGVAR